MLFGRRPHLFHTSAEIALWMVGHVYRYGSLAEVDAIPAVATRFGNRFVKVNVRGDLGLAPLVLKEFWTISSVTIAWDHEARTWRPRRPSDGLGRHDK
jgi:hypothetical protein